jgi:hypothetical protein
MRISLAVIIIVFLICPAISRTVNCEMVRSYVASYGKERAVAMARAAGMTTRQVRTASHCLVRHD